MILHGNQRAGGNNLALHLLKDENDHVEIHELRGFVSNNLKGAFNEAYAISRGTKAKQYLFSLSLNPPLSENVPTQAFEDAIERVEKKLKLTGQPRVIVFHEKEGRRHCHAVWSRIDAQVMKAIPMSHSKRKLMDIARELYREHGWQMPRGFINSQERDPRNFTLAQWQQAKRIGKDPRTIKEAFQNSWAVSDNQSAFQNALKENGFILARGDRRGFVAVDSACEVYAVAKWTGIKTKEVRGKLTDRNSLPSVDEAKAKMAQQMEKHLNALKQDQRTAIKKRLSGIEKSQAKMTQNHKTQRTALHEMHQKRWEEERYMRQERFNKGIRGLLDWITGERRRIKKLNEEETRHSDLRDKEENDALVFQQLEQHRILQSRKQRLSQYQYKQEKGLLRDIQQYREIRDKERKRFTYKSPSSPEHSTHERER